VNRDAIAWTSECRSKRAVRAALIVATASMVFGNVARAEESLASVLRGFREWPVRATATSIVAPAVPLSEPLRPVVAAIRNSYSKWAQEVFSAEELVDERLSAPDAVCAADGLTNVTKYALGLDPRVDAPAAALPEMGQLDEHWLLWYRRPSDTDDVEYRVEVSTDDGASWSSAGVTQEPILANDVAQSWQAHYHAATDEGVRLRLVVGLK
jgi:hypothetical protein